MTRCLQVGMFILVLLSLILSASRSVALSEDKGLKTSVFLSPKFVLGPGAVENRFYYNVDFPKGHIAVKSFNAEVVDEAGNPVSLHETYLHHWIMRRYYKRVDVKAPAQHSNLLHKSDIAFGGNAGLCQGNVLRQHFGLGSETRKTATHVPDPFGIEVGNPAEVPTGYESRWLLNVHAIDMRGVVDRLGCSECRCHLYNVTKDEYGRPLRPDYHGGLLCCYDQTQCRLRDGFEGVRRALYLRYTVKWLDWETSIVPVKIYILDVTDIYQRLNDSAGISTEHNCLVEYEIKSRSGTAVGDDGCNDSKRAHFTMPSGGYIIYAVAHQHTGGTGATLYGEDGKSLCTSLPIYGQGTEAGNEAGNIVGMTTCYPEPGSVKIAKGESLAMESNYSCSQGHVGVMGLFYVMAADEIPMSLLSSRRPLQLLKVREVPLFAWVAAFLGVGIAAGFLIRYRTKGERGDGYERMLT